MKEHGIGDEANIKEIIAEVDKDNVSSYELLFVNDFSFCSPLGWLIS